MGRSNARVSTASFTLEPWAICWLWTVSDGGPVRTINNETAWPMGAFPDMVSGFCYVNPTLGEKSVVREVERCVAKGFRSVAGSSVHAIKTPSNTSEAIPMTP